MTIETLPINRAAGFHDASAIVNVAFDAAAGCTAVECVAQTMYQMVCTEDCYFRWTTDGGTVADANDSYMPANTITYVRSGTLNKFMTALGKSTTGVLKLTAMIPTGS